MKYKENGWLKLDIFLQLFLLAPSITAAFVAIFSPEWIFFTLLINFFLGLLQIFSTFVYALIYRNRFAQKYLIAILIYFIFAGLILSLNPMFPDSRPDLMIMIGIILPLIMACVFAYNIYHYKPSFSKKPLTDEDILDDLSF